MISWLEKLGLGLKKSSQKIGGGISGIFTKRKLDAETLEELEELLIASDMGVRTAAAIVGEFSKMRQDKEISEQEIREKLAAELLKTFLSLSFDPNSSSAPKVACYRAYDQSR